ncbi:nucleoside/nucleotide kinase family protein [Rubrivivax gelatinosus]|uniref:Nucleoside/nucleotide kinase family protein n=1 Tax=Rubrivivax gelatinosus TaxID=28068 RepID=A0ABS1DWE1_RUBGE|nr:nucleoside/nucleotide kinase family protein [Rubrivivax gelatinosus]MBK1714367.1 nucleoside/nucleotide kinase family protein [Rubrivivax gelatinosus]
MAAASAEPVTQWTASRCTKLARVNDSVPEIWIARARALATGGRRRLLGIAGPPGAGKSTLAAALSAALAPAAVVVPMDGFHLANSALEQLGRRGRKGAPDTFDAAGYRALLQRLHEGAGTVWAPEFRREIGEPVAGAIAVPAEVPLVITEGNYLLLEDGAWGGVAALLDECWYVEVDDALRRERLAARHRRFGRSAEAAAAWVQGTDEPNARLVAAARDRADAVFHWPAER